MSVATPRSARSFEALLLALAFAVAYTQSPLFYSNQNQYLLHGLAAGGYGHLNHDWLANTHDPTPLFSALIAAGYRHLGLWSIQAAYFLLLMGYFLSARWLVVALPGVPDSRTFRLAFAALFTAAHAAILRVASVELTGVDYPWYLQCGVANQYLLGPGLQPSALGTCLFAAVAAFARGHTLLAGFVAGLACAFHSTYLLPLAMLLTGFVIVLVKDTPHHGPSALKMLLAASASAVPAFAYALFTFGPANAETFAQSQHILADIRIPHHAHIDRWFALPDALQLTWIAVGLGALRRSSLFFVMLIAVGLGFVLTLVEYEVRSPTLALLFPWRISALLVPVATAAICAKLAALVSESRPAEWVSGGIVLSLAAAGAWIMAAGIGYRTNDAERDLLEYARTHAGPKDVYLLPVSFPSVGTGRGTASTTFTPPPRPKPGSNLIPVDLQRFRLATGVPISVDFKSVPYLDREVLEWYHRLKQCEEWYAGDWSAPGQVQELRGAGITHVVTPATRPITSDSLRQVHADAAYIVYEVR